MSTVSEETSQSCEPKNFHLQFFVLAMRNSQERFGLYLTETTGDFFVHFLDSPEQGLLVIPLFTDILPNGGGTWICSDGVSRIGQWLVSGNLIGLSVVIFPQELLRNLHSYLAIESMALTASYLSTTILKVSFHACPR